MGHEVGLMECDISAMGRYSDQRSSDYNEKWMWEPDKSNKGIN